MELLSINIGKAEPMPNAKQTGVTGIDKRSVNGPVMLTTAGLPGDAICDVDNHGGVDQAIYIYGADDYIWWAEELGYELDPGMFGENLTVTGLESGKYSIGDRFQIGDVILEITAPRIPCVTLATHMGDPTFVKRFRFAERPGLYCRVVQEGRVRVGEDVRVQQYAGETITVLEMFRQFYEPTLDESTLRKHLAAPIAIRARVDKQEKLRALLAKGENP